MRFDDVTKRMVLSALQPGVEPEDVQAQTGFELQVDASLTRLPEPTGREIDIVRALDPDQVFL